ncbi:hypothetical protein SERLA73DRAFT_149036 [Serpula lacrymans var. lacrymans S7.3]|uniref:Uncharacterized protein n=1 Tax=Serpula lacrymans var. lacrymans (strain S7.3) TaxID=936435 RepID=F8PHV7_SERL3|nr:hypothetical protein SERLA73DRAFT_149036 [Serpula lacrymans var. lacrymans S7.3]
MEQQQPLLALCSNHWKAEHMLGQLLRSNVSEAAKKHWPQKEASKEATEMGMDIDNNITATKMLIPPPSSVPTKKSPPPPWFLIAIPKPRNKKHNTDFIQVDASLENLKAILYKDFPFASVGLHLLDAIEHDPNFSPGPTSPQVFSFIERIKQADPNSPKFDEDNHDTYLQNAIEHLWEVWRAAGGLITTNLVTVILALLPEKQPSKTEVALLMTNQKLKKVPCKATRT